MQRYDKLLKTKEEFLHAEKKEIIIVRTKRINVIHSHCQTSDMPQAIQYVSYCECFALMENNRWTLNARAPRALPRSRAFWARVEWVLHALHCSNEANTNNSFTSRILDASLKKKKTQLI